MSWSEEIDLVCSECPELRKNSPKVIIKQKALLKIVALLHKFPHVEWGAYCIGSKDENGYYIEDLKIPKQEVNRSNVEFKENKFPKNCIGWIHSHNSMDAFLSETDKSSASIYDVTLVVNNRLDIAAAVKIKLSCGRFALTEAEAELEIENELDEEIANIVEKKEKYLVELTEKDRICVVCGQKLPKKKRKLRYCKYCNNWVHIQCYIEELKMCANCYEELQFKSDNSDYWSNIWYRPIRELGIE